jgi:hypothetical protein
MNKKRKFEARNPNPCKAELNNIQNWGHQNWQNGVRSIILDSFYCSFRILLTEVGSDQHRRDKSLCAKWVIAAAAVENKIGTTCPQGRP